MSQDSAFHDIVLPCVGGYEVANPYFCSPCVSEVLYRCVTVCSVNSYTSIRRQEVFGKVRLFALIEADSGNVQLAKFSLF